MQAHSSTGKGRNANWALIPFLAEMKAVFERLRTDRGLQDAAYDPPFSDFNLVIDNHGAAVNVTVPLATARIKFRYSAKIDPTPVLAAVHAAAARAGVTVTEAREGIPPELPADHPLVRLCADTAWAQAPRTAPYGTDASELQAIAPCVVLGPGDIAVAHTPAEHVSSGRACRRGAAVHAPGRGRRRRLVAVAPRPLAGPSCRAGPPTRGSATGRQTGSTGKNHQTGANGS